MLSKRVTKLGKNDIYPMTKILEDRVPSYRLRDNSEKYIESVWRTTLAVERNENFLKDLSR